MMRTTSCCLVLASVTCAQNPAPAGETSAVWSAEESQAFAYCQEVAQAWRHWRGRGRRDWSHLKPGLLPGYSVARTEWQNGNVERIDDRANPTLLLKPGSCLFYIAPTNDKREARRAFCVRGDGIAAFTDNTKARSLLGEHRFVGDDVLGAGGKADLREFPRSPTMGRDGNLWQPIDMLRQTTIRVQLLHENGVPMPMWTVECAPAEELFAVGTPLVAGRMLTTLEGDAELSGMAATGLGFTVVNRGLRVCVPADKVAVRGRSVRITVPSKAIKMQRINANESAAIATLKNICSAQAQCQACGIIDTNSNGQGEYGTFAEMSGQVIVRGSKRRLRPPVLSASFRNVKNGMVVRSGYCFQMFLPGKGAKPVPEQAKGGAKDAPVDSALAEMHWCCYAWPIEAGESGQQAFFVSEAGDVLAVSNTNGRYSGPGKGPDGNAARIGNGGLAASAAAHQDGMDKQKWIVVR